VPDGVNQIRKMKMRRTFQRSAFLKLSTPYLNKRLRKGHAIQPENVQQLPTLTVSIAVHLLLNDGAATKWRIWFYTFLFILLTLLYFCGYTITAFIHFVHYTKFFIHLFLYIHFLYTEWYIQRFLDKNKTPERGHAFAI